MKTRYSHTYTKWGWVLLIGILLSTMARPAQAAPQVPQQVHQPAATTLLDTRIYLTRSTMQPLFQTSINMLVPSTTNATIDSIVKQMPTKDQSWARLLAETLVEPSAQLTTLEPRAEGLYTSVRINLFPGDPQPINAQLLVKFTVQNNSTIDVIAEPIAGSPTVMNGKLQTFKMPIGILKTVTPTLTCGDSALAINMVLPIENGGSTNAQGGAQAFQQQHVPQHTLTMKLQTELDTQVEIPMRALTALGKNMGELQINDNQKAQNIRLSTQNGKLVVTSDIINKVFGASINLGTATTLIQPQAKDGKLVLKVEKTSIKVFSIFNFAADNYNKQIEQLLEKNVTATLNGKIKVTTAAMGPSKDVPCVAKDSLLLQGKINMDV